MYRLFLSMGAALFVSSVVSSADATRIQEGWDYAPAMKKVAAAFTGKEGVVLHIGDSITYANPYSQWARHGKGKTARDDAICKWMHTGKRDDTDGWHLCSVDREGGRSDTAVGGIRADEMLAGGKSGIAPLKDLVKRYHPRMVVLMLGTNDASAGRKTSDYKKDMARAVDIILANGSIPVLSTLPPHPGRPELVKSYNAALKEIGKDKKIPMIDYWREIIKRRPRDWNGTLLGKNDVHPTAAQGGATAASEPTQANLKNSGYLLRGWLSVRKIAEVKERVLDK
jgi:lysophospholipase L1-like esterase